MFSRRPESMPDKKESLIVPLGPERAELIVVNSRFISSLDRVGSVEEARAFIARVRAEFPDATHNVPAFIVGGGNSRIEFCSDDGEPSGTSGRPLLAALRGSGFGNVVVVVTRYFGGTLLGTGGLVKAYSKAGKLVLERAKRGELVEAARFELELPYRLFESFRRMAEDLGAKLLSSDFAETVRITMEVPLFEVDEFRSRFADLGGGDFALTQIGIGHTLIACCRP